MAKQYNIDGTLVLVQYIGENGFDWAAWNDTGEVQVAYGATEQQAVNALRVLLRATDSAIEPSQVSGQSEAFSRQRENVWRPGKSA